MKPTHLQLYCVVAVAVVFGQLLAFGANSALLATLLSEFCLLAAGACLLLERGPRMERAYLAAAGPLALLALAILWVILPVIAPSIAPQRAVPDYLLVELVKLAALGVLVLLGVQIGRNPRGLRVAVFWLLCAGLVYLLASLWLWRDHPTEVWGQVKGRHLGRFTGTLLNANAAACLCATVALLGLAQLHAAFAPERRPTLPEDWIEAGVAIVAILFSILTIFLTASRTAGICLAAFALIQALATKRRRRGGGLRRAIAVVVLGGAGVIGAVVLRGAATFDRPFGSEDSYVRLAAWRVVTDLIQQSPLFGYGLGAYRQLNQSHLEAAKADYLWDLGAAHQPILQAALEGGIPFAAALVAAVAWVAVSAGRNLGRRAVGQELALGCVAATGLIFAAAQVDIALNVPAVASLAMLLLGLAWGWSLSLPSGRRSTNEPNP
jgi:O-antigen ligase